MKRLLLAILLSSSLFGEPPKQNIVKVGCLPALTLIRLLGKGGFGEASLVKFNLDDKRSFVYNKFKNAATQIVTAEKILPVELESFVASEKEDTTYVSDFSFEPSKKDLLFTIIPRAVKTQLYRTMLDSQASEHGSRMVAMDKATENAGEIIYDLKLQYNQARQAAITTEILEIVGGAAALEG